MKPSDILSQLDENYLTKLRLMAATYRISIEDIPFAYTVIQDCNQALETKQAERLSGYDTEDCEFTFV